MWRKRSVGHGDGQGDTDRPPTDRRTDQSDIVAPQSITSGNTEKGTRKAVFLVELTSQPLKDGARGP